MYPAGEPNGETGGLRPASMGTSIPLFHMYPMPPCSFIALPTTSTVLPQACA